jgi:hypothetical protein
MALILSGTDGLSDVDGSASTPAIRGADINTGIFFPAADTIAFSEGGVESMRIDSSGNLGIGTASPSNAKLHVVGNWVGGSSTVKTQTITSFAGGGQSGYGTYDSDGTRVGIFYSYVSGTVLGTSTSSSLNFETNNTERMRIDTNGNVGIGTSSPGSGIRLDVLGGEIRAGRVDSSSEGGQVSFSRSSDNATAWYLDVFGNTSTPSLRVVDVSSGAVRATFDSSGNFQFNSGYGSATTAYGVRAWINYNGTNNAIRASGGVSSITDRGTGNWDVNFSFSMPDANYSALGSRSYRGVTNFEGNAVNYARVYCAEVDVPYLFDPEFVYVAIVR